MSRKYLTVIQSCLRMAKDLPAPEKLTLLYIADDTDRGGCGQLFGLAELSRIASCSPQRARTAVKNLRRAGIISLEWHGDAVQVWVDPERINVRIADIQGQTSKEAGNA